MQGKISVRKFFVLSRWYVGPPRPVYELEDLNKQLIYGQFYEEVLTPVRITKQTQFHIDKIVRTRVRRGNKEQIVRWKGYSSDFDSCVKASDIKKI